MAARGIDSPGPKTSLNAADQSSKPGVSAAVPAAVIFPAPAARGVGVAPVDTESQLPR